MKSTITTNYTATQPDTANYLIIFIEIHIPPLQRSIAEGGVIARTVNEISRKFSQHLEKAASMVFFLLKMPTT